MGGYGESNYILRGADAGLERSPWYLGLLPLLAVCWRFLDEDNAAVSPTLHPFT